MDAIDQRIQDCRTAQVTLSLVDPSGAPLAGQRVTIHQMQHKFLFGSAILQFDQCRSPQENAAYKARCAELLNFATLPFYWQRYEPLQGKPDKARLISIAEWCAQHDITPKGHPLVWTLEPEWASERFAPPAGEWASTGSTDLAERLLLGRITREVESFAGRIDVWDVINEVVNALNQARERGALCLLQYYERYGQHEVVKRVFEAARQANPRATLILNEHRRFAGLEELLRHALDQGVPIDAIGLQSHMLHRYWGVQEAWEVCERFAEYDLPLHFTEVSIPAGTDTHDTENAGVAAEDLQRTRWSSTPEAEERQAQRVVEWYRTLFSHPAVEAITWWNITDYKAFQSAPIGLLREDLSPKPAYNALLELVKRDWWTGPLDLTTDERGQVCFRAFLGAYTVRHADQQSRFSVDHKGESSLRVCLDAGEERARAL
jgi:GH35 family endo-1,4-beta-xylanase